jgi:hypothetical protein
MAFPFLLIPPYFVVFILPHLDLGDTTQNFDVYGFLRGYFITIFVATVVIFLIVWCLTVGCEVSTGVGKNSKRDVATSKERW